MVRVHTAGLVAAVLAAWAAAPAGARAGDLALPGQLEVYPTWHAVGISASCKGDENDNAVPRLSWREGGQGRWRDGVEMTRCPKRKLWWASIFPLEPGQSIQVRVAFDDPDRSEGGRAANQAVLPHDCENPLPLVAGTVAEQTSLHGPAVPKALLERTVTTRVLNTKPGGRHIRVSPRGDADFRSIAKAVRQLKPGDVVHVAAGLYKEEVVLGKAVRGTPDKPILILAQGEPAPVIDTSVTLPPGAAWKRTADGLYSIPLAAKPALRLLTQDAKRVYGYTSLDELKKDEHRTGRAFFHDRKAGLLYLRTGSGKPAGAHRYVLAQRDHAIVLDGASCVIIKGLEFRHTAEAAVEIRGGGDGNAVLANRFFNCGLAVSVDDLGCDRTAVWNNDIRQEGQTDYGWRALMSEHWQFPRDGICLWTGRGTSVVGNRVDGYHNLVVLEPKPGKPRKTAATSTDGNRDLDIFYNRLLNGSDDAIEADYGAVNMRIYGNHTRNCNSAVSAAPCMRGPVYVRRNTFTFRTLMFKFGIGGGSSGGACYCDHNSGYGLTAGLGMGIYFNRNLPTENKHFRNNILVLPGRDAVLAMRPGNTLDGNSYWNPAAAVLKFHWLEDDKWHRGLGGFRRLGLEKAGFIADPMLASTPGLAGYTVSDYELNCAGEAGLVTSVAEADFRLRPGSPCIDRAVRLRGVNDDYAGNAPDIGALESGGPGGD